MRRISIVCLLMVLLLITACGGQAAPAQAPEDSSEPPAETDASTGEQEEAEPTEETAEAPADDTEGETEVSGSGEGEAIHVGLLTDQSGPLAVYGPMQERGFQLGLEYATDGTMEVAGRPIEVIVKDNGSDPETAVSQARELISAEGADILVGSVSSGATRAVMEVAKENQVILIAEPAASPSITGENFNEYTFRTSRTSVQDALTMAKALTEMGDTFVQIAPDYEFGYGSAKGFYNIIKGSGGTFAINDSEEGLGAVFIPQDTTDFTTYLNQVLDSGADVVIVTWAGASFAPLFQQMQTVGIFDEMTVATGFGDNQTVKAGFANAIGTVGVSVYHYTLPDNEVNDWLVKHHMEEYSGPPDLFTAGGFAAAQMVVSGLEASEGDASADALIPVLEGLSFQGPKGEYTVRPEDHVMLQPLYLVELTNVDDSELKFFKLLETYGAEETAPPCAVPEEKGRC